MILSELGNKNQIFNKISDTSWLSLKITDLKKTKNSVTML